MAEDDEGYAIGRGKPPRHARFQKGRSGNPHGRPKGAKNLATILGKALSERIVVTEHGRRRSLSKLDVAVRQLVNKAAAGDPKFLPQLLALVQLVEGRTAALAPPAQPLTEADRRMIDAIYRRLAGQGKTDDV